MNDMKTILLVVFSIFSVYSSYAAEANRTTSCPHCSGTPFPTLLVIDDIERSSVYQALSGSWEHTALAPDILVSEGLCATREQALSARLIYTFQANGRFEKKLESTELGATLINSGRWQLSNDQQYIVLEYAQLDAPYNEVIAIRHLDRDELVLEQEPTFHKAPTQIQAREFFFNKL